MLTKFLFSAFLFVLSYNASAQISGGEIKPEKKEKVKGEKRTKNTNSFSSDSLAGSVFYITGLVQHSFRKFEDQSFAKIYDSLNNEMPTVSGGVTIGTIMPLNKNWGLDAGITYFGHGEAFKYEDPETDSSFNYTNTYMQIGVPLKLRYTYGRDFQVFGFAGITPINILNIRYNSNYTNETGTLFENDLVSVKDGFTAFNIMASAGLGVNYYVKNIGFTLGGEYRRHLANTYSENTFKRNHKMFGYGLNFGVLVRI